MIFLIKIKEKQAKATKSCVNLIRELLVIYLHFWYDLYMFMIKYYKHKYELVS